MNLQPGDTIQRGIDYYRVHQVTTAGIVVRPSWYITNSQLERMFNDPVLKAVIFRGTENITRRVK